MEQYNFTPKEKQVIDCLLKGYCNKEITREMDLALVTVKMHLKSIYEKVGYNSRLKVVLKLLGVIE